MRRAKLLNQLTNRLFPVGNRPQRPNLTIWLGDRYRNRFCMDIQPNKSYLFHDRFLSALWLCVVGFTNSQRNPRQRIGAGRSILTNR
jgi:hypothetical protein